MKRFAVTITRYERSSCEAVLIIEAANAAAAEDQARARLRDEDIHFRENQDFDSDTEFAVRRAKAHETQ